MSRFLSNRFSHMTPYVPGEQPQDMKYIKLNTNESPFPPSPKVLEAIKSEYALKLNLYPDPGTAPFCEALADLWGLKKENFLAGNGSDEILAFAFMGLCGPDIKVCFPSLSYGFYPVFADLFALDAKAIPLKPDFSIDPEDYFKADRTIFIANPNAPTGLTLSPEQIEKILQNNPDHPVVIDEAYVDFGGKSVIPLIQKYDNLLVVQTLSKSRSLAGMRIGYAAGSSDLISDLNMMKYSFNPYNVNRIAIAAGTAAIKDKAYFEQCTHQIMETREWTRNALIRLGFDVIPSKSNFLFVSGKCLNGNEHYSKLRAHGILVRYFNKPEIAGYVRISIGSQSDMEKLIAQIQSILEEKDL